MAGLLKKKCKFYQNKKCDDQSMKYHALYLKFANYADPFGTNLLRFGNMHSCLALNLLQFVSGLGALYALRR
jgi:hypothetical protein